MKRALAGSAVVVALGALGLAAAYRMRLRPWQLRWGATDEEAVVPLPGDELLKSADLSATRAMTIEARRELVWPWIAQIGQGRGGFYSYDALENLAGCEIESADAIVAEWQRIEAGDEVRLHPELALTVAQVEPGQALVLRGGEARGGETLGGEEMPFDFTWAFVLREADGGTRLLVRERYQYLHPAAAQLVEPVSLISFIMTRKMLQGIRERAERTANPALA